MPDDYFGNEEQLLFKIVYLLEKSENSNLKDTSKEVYINIKNKFIRLFKNINNLEFSQTGGSIFTHAVSSVTSFFKTRLLGTSFNEKLNKVIIKSNDLPSDNDNIVADFLKCFTIKMPNDKKDDNNNDDKIRTYYCTINDFVETSDLNDAINYTLRYEEVRKFIEKYKSIEEYKVLTNILTLISFNSNIEINRLKSSRIYYEYSKLTGTNLYSKIHTTLKKLITDYRKERNNLLNEKYFDLQIIQDDNNDSDDANEKQEIFFKEASLEELNKNIDIINQTFMKYASKALFYIQEHIFLFFKENKNLDSIDYSLLQISSPLLNKDTSEYEDNLEKMGEEPDQGLEPELDQGLEPELDQGLEPDQVLEPESDQGSEAEQEEGLEEAELVSDQGLQPVSDQGLESEPKPEPEKPEKPDEPKPDEPESEQPDPLLQDSVLSETEQKKPETGNIDSSMGGKRSKNNKNKFYKKTKKRKKKKYSRKIY